MPFGRFPKHHGQKPATPRARSYVLPDFVSAVSVKRTTAMSMTRQTLVAALQLFVILYLFFPLLGGIIIPNDFYKNLCSMIFNPIWGMILRYFKWIDGFFLWFSIPLTRRDHHECRTLRASKLQALVGRDMYQWTEDPLGDTTNLNHGGNSAINL